MLPHPKDQNDLAQYNLKAHFEKDAVTPSSYGLVSALSVAEHLGIHPYSYHETLEYGLPEHLNEEEYRKYFNKEKLENQKNIYSLFEEDCFYYLKDVNVADFYKIVSDESLIDEEILARLKFKSDDSAERRKARFNALAKAVRDRNASLSARGAGSFGVVYGLLQSLCSLGYNTITDNWTSLGSNTLAATGVIISMLALVDRLGMKDHSDVVVQVFCDIENKVPRPNDE